MRAFVSLAGLSSLWFVVWGVFIFVLQPLGFDYVNNFLFTCVYFGLATGFLYTYFKKRIKHFANHFSAKDVAIVVMLYVVAAALFMLVRTFVSGDVLGYAVRNFDYTFWMDERHLVAKAFEIMFQQAFFIVSIDFLFRNGFSKITDMFLFGLYSLALHVPIIFILPAPFSWVLLGGSFCAGFLFSYFITYYKRGFIISYGVHFMFYVLCGVGYWLGYLAGMVPLVVR